MIILIGGMHRSGTSMVARLLNLCGVYLGDEKDLIQPAEDNPEGFWEHPEFRNVNEEILTSFGGNWDLPPVLEDGWEKSPHLDYLQARVGNLINQFSKQPVWGWKDPQNSLTLPYWKSLIPELRIVVCLRNPHDVYRSLARRGYSSRAFSYNLWMTYYHHLFAAANPGTFIVTHFESYFHDPQSELRRLVEHLGIKVSNETIMDACKSVSTGLRHNQSGLSDPLDANAPPELARLYKDLCRQAGQIYYLSVPPKERESLESADPPVEMTLEECERTVTLLKFEIQKLTEELKNIRGSRTWRLAQALKKIRFFIGKAHEKN